MTRVRHTSMLAVPVVCLSFAFCVLGKAPGPEDEARLQKVSSILGANLSAIRSVECDYVLDWNGLERRCRYLREGEKHYHASIDTTPQGVRSMPLEVAWNGKCGYLRRKIGYLVSSADERVAKPSCEPPERAIMTYLNHALGMSGDGRLKFTFRSSMDVQHEGRECIELTFDAPWLPGTLVSRHAREFAYAPVSILLTDGGGRKVFEMKDVSYERVNLDGKALFYPVGLTLHSTALPGKRGDVSVFRADARTLRINAAVDQGRFSLTPWPCEYVEDLSTGKAAVPADPNWSPSGKVGFPFDAPSKEVPAERDR